MSPTRLLPFVLVLACEGKGDSGEVQGSTEVGPATGDTVGNTGWYDYSDSDGDGYSVYEGDCDDTNPDVSPGATEICDDGIDNDCDTLIDTDDDDCSMTTSTGTGTGTGTGTYTSSGSGTGTGTSTTLNTGWYDYNDNDGDGYSGYDGDCDDTDPDVNPGATEICDDGIDNDCDWRVDGADLDCGATTSPTPGTGTGTATGTGTTPGTGTGAAPSSSPRRLDWSRLQWAQPEPTPRTTSLRRQGSWITLD